MKRIFDLIITVSLLVILAPVLFLVALLFLFIEGPPVLYHHQRLGLNGQAFTLIKFRTMHSGTSISAQDDASRITGLGRILRRTSLDELPTLYNVLKGEMSLVGPRPLPVKYKDRFSSVQFRRHQVRPGITGLAQTKGRNSLSWTEKFDYDLHYVENRSFLMDMRILCHTIFLVLKGQGVSPHDQEIMPEFMGTAAPSAKPPASEQTDKTDASD
jgi:lipopolysaccharide/colanic/teichoic acid biosynthesis glycosyltransferase